MKNRKRMALRLAAQGAIVFFLALGAELVRPVRWLHLAATYGLLSLAGAYTAYRVVRAGVNPYVGWILPPLAATAAGFLASLGYAPAAGPVLLTAFFSLAGAAVGDVIQKQRNGRGRGKR